MVLLRRSDMSIGWVGGFKSSFRKIIFDQRSRNENISFNWTNKKFKMFIFSINLIVGRVAIIT